MNSEAQPGDFGLAKIGGGGLIHRLVKWGQFLIGDNSPWSHAFLVLDNYEVVEAQPGGAILTPLFRYYASRANKNAVIVNMNLTEEQRAKVVEAGRSFVGVPYNWLDYIVLALSFFHIRPQFVINYMKSRKHMICSQLVDQAYLTACVHLFDDGRLSQDVTPGDLYKYAKEKGLI